MIIAALIILPIYFLVIFYFGKGIDRLQGPFRDGKDPIHRFSIIVPFRNEAVHLPMLLNSIAALDYPMDLYEVILIDDASSDGSVAIIEEFKRQHPNIKLNLTDNTIKSNSPKKDAIIKGISLADNTWIITTDADCVVPHTWLAEFDNMIRQRSLKMLVAPVIYTDNPGFLNQFQLLDFLSLQGISIGSFGHRDSFLGKPFLCNGANLCYDKEGFEAVNGFDGNEHIASGDDVFLLQKMMERFPDQVQFLKSREAVVLTSPKDTLRGLLQQRIRWASKTSALKATFPKVLGLLIFGTNLLILIAFVLGISGQVSLAQAGLLFLLKFNIDFLFLHKTSQFFEQQHVMRSYFLSSLIYPFFTVAIVILSFFGGYGWKGRAYR